MRFRSWFGTVQYFDWMRGNQNTVLTAMVVNDQPLK